MFIKDNVIKSTDYSPASGRGSANWQSGSGGNCGVHLHCQTGQKLTIERNDIENFYTAVFVGTPTPLGRNVHSQGIHWNAFRDCGYGIWWAGGSTNVADCQICIGNSFEGIATGNTFAGYNGNGVYLGSTYAGNGNSVEILSNAGLTDPAYGTWAVGDRYISNGPGHGSFIGKVCITAGAAGSAVWTTYGAIT